MFVCLDRTSWISKGIHSSQLDLFTRRQRWAVNWCGRQILRWTSMTDIFNVRSEILQGECDERMSVYGTRWKQSSFISPSFFPLISVSHSPPSPRRPAKQHPSCASWCGMWTRPELACGQCIISERKKVLSLPKMLQLLFLLNDTNSWCWPVIHCDILWVTTLRQVRCYICMK